MSLKRRRRNEKKINNKEIYFAYRQTKSELKLRFSNCFKFQLSMSALGDFFYFVERQQNRLNSSTLAIGILKNWQSQALESREVQFHTM